MDFYKTYPLLERDLPLYHQFHELDPEILSLLEEQIGEIPLKKASKEYVSSLIKDNFRRILLDKYQIPIDSLQEQMELRFLDWLKRVNSKCTQLGYGYSFYYQVQKTSTLHLQKKLIYQDPHHHWGISSEKYDPSLRPTQDVIMIGYLLDVVFSLSSACRREIWGN